MNFSETLTLLKAGMRLRRKNWGEGKVVMLCRSVHDDNDRYLVVVNEIVSMPTQAQPFAPDSKDLLAEDWELSDLSQDKHTKTKDMLKEMLAASQAWENKIRGLV